MSFEVVLRSFPNNELRCGWYKCQPHRSKSVQGRDSTDVPEPTLPSLTLGQNSKRSPEPKPQGNSTGYGKLGRQTKFSSYAKRKLLQAGAVMDELAPKSEVLFITATLPGSTRAAYRALAEFSGYAIHRFKAWVAKRVSAKWDFWCWEWQRRGALHLHYAVHVPDPDKRAEIKRLLKEEWARILDSICELSGVDLWARKHGGTWKGRLDVLQVKCEEVKKSVARYLAKYFSKGQESGGKKVEQAFYPSRWYGVSRPLNQAIRERTWEVMRRVVSSRSEAERLYSDTSALIASWGVRCYSYRNKYGLGDNTLVYYSDSEKETIKTWIQTMGAQQKNSSPNIDATVRNLVFHLIQGMTRYGCWHANFYTFASVGSQALVRSYAYSKCMSTIEMVSLVDDLTYALHWTCMTTFTPSVEHLKSAKQVRELMNLPKLRFAMSPKHYQTRLSSEDDTQSHQSTVVDNTPLGLLLCTEQLRLL